MTDYARDPQGRPVSEDGRWVWNGTEWEPHQAQQETPPADTSEPEPAADEVASAATPVTTSDAAVLGAEVRGTSHTTAPLNSGRVAAVNPRYARSAVVTSSTSDDEMTLARMAATTVGVVLALGGALMLGVTIMTILVMRAFESALSSGTMPTTDPRTVVYAAYAIGFAVATAAAFSVLYAARVPKAILGAVGIVAISLVAFYVIRETGIEVESLSGVLLLPLVPAAATAGFVKWATR